METSRILLVDDEKDILDLLEYNLTRAGFQVFTAQNGLQGYELAQKLRPHLIILDYMMPELDGIQTCQLLKEHPLLRKTTVAMLSARSDSEVVRSAFKVGADDYIAKPISPKLFVDKVKHLLAS